MLIGNDNLENKLNGKTIARKTLLCFKVVANIQAKINFLTCQGSE